MWPERTRLIFKRTPLGDSGLRSHDWVERSPQNQSWLRTYQLSISGVCKPSGWAMVSTVPAPSQRQKPIRPGLCQTLASSDEPVRQKMQIIKRANGGLPQLLELAPGEGGVNELLSWESQSLHLYTLAQTPFWAGCAREGQAAK